MTRMDRIFVEPSSPLKKPPGEGTGPTTDADSQGNIVGRVPSRGGTFGVMYSERIVGFNQCLQVGIHSGKTSARSSSASCASIGA